MIQRKDFLDQYLLDPDPGAGGQCCPLKLYVLRSVCSNVAFGLRQAHLMALTDVSGEKMRKPCGACPTLSGVAVTRELGDKKCNLVKQVPGGISLNQQGTCLTPCPSSYHCCICHVPGKQDDL